MQIAFSIRSGGRSARIIFLLSALMCVGVAVISYRYLVNSALAPPLIARNAFREPWLILHVVFAATALLVAPMQFSPRVRLHMPSAHRWMGRVYVASCLLGGVSGFILALGASTGFISSWGFGLLAIAWIASTWLAWRAAVAKRFVDHRAWMIRSFALTFAAVTLRLYLGIAGIAPIPFETSYQLISFACWVPNLIVAEMILRLQADQSNKVAAQSELSNRGN